MQKDIAVNGKGLQNISMLSNFCKSSLEVVKETVENLNLNDNQLKTFESGTHFSSTTLKVIPQYYFWGVEFKSSIFL